MAIYPTIHFHIPIFLFFFLNIQKLLILTEFCVPKHHFMWKFHSIANFSRQETLKKNSIVGGKNIDGRHTPEKCSVINEIQKGHLESCMLGGITRDLPNSRQAKRPSTVPKANFTAFSWQAHPFAADWLRGLSCVTSRLAAHWPRERVTRWAGLCDGQHSQPISGGKGEEREGLKKHGSCHLSCSPLHQCPSLPSPPTSPGKLWVQTAVATRTAGSTN